jgi:quercetin dioxygenase-like cupin family protein
MDEIRAKFETGHGRFCDSGKFLINTGSDKKRRDGLMAEKSPNLLIQKETEISAYIPPGHEGTVNIRLIDKDFCGAFEMNLGVVQPGGEAAPHSHETEHQVVYIIDGKADVVLGDAPSVECGPGTIIRIPPKLEHAVYAKGDRPLRVIVLYSPPLGPRVELPAD